MRPWSRFLNPALIVLLAFSAIVLIIPIAIRLSVAPYTYTSTTEVPKTEVAIVLGASVYDDKPSPVLADRADTAIALYQSGKVSKILVTGDNGALTHDEVTPVRKYLLAAGIPAQDIFLDHAGFDTYSSMYRAKAIFGATSVTITTQDFHLPRALWIARELGLEAYGVVADGGENSANEYIREIGACTKAVFDVAVRRVPKFLGPPIPLGGNGQVTWY